MYAHSHNSKLKSQNTITQGHHQDHHTRGVDYWGAAVRSQLLLIYVMCLTSRFVTHKLPWHLATQMFRHWHPLNVFAFHSCIQKSSVAHRRRITSWPLCRICTFCGKRLQSLTARVRYTGLVTCTPWRSTHYESMSIVSGKMVPEGYV